ncbi:signal transducer and activator of transcription 6 [Stigmatopora nigra]
MAQWALISQHILPVETMNELYPSSTFPIEVRHYLRDWIEKQNWDMFALENVEQEANAHALLNQLVMMLEAHSHQITNVVDKMKLMQISKHMSMFQPLQFAVMVRDTLHKERLLLRDWAQVNNTPQHQQFVAKEVGFSSTQNVDLLVLKVLEVQDLRQKIHQLQEELNWEKQNFESLQGAAGILDPPMLEVTQLQKHIEQLAYSVNTMATKRFQLLAECVDCLDQCQAQLISTLKIWRWEQYKATIGHRFDDNLNFLQMWCEQLLGVNGKLRQELMLIVEPVPELQERLGQLLKLLVQSSLVVDKQPPQVIKTQSKFTTTVRYLLGETIAPGKPVVLKAQIINELQARNLNISLSDNVGEVINNTAILEHNTASKSTCATFRNMSIKKIKRADRKGSESVTEEKFALLFSTEINITGSDTPFKIQIISLPLVIIVHGSQDNNALATIIWDCAFSEIDRVPFAVPERVPWKLMCSTLNSKFMSEVQTEHCLDENNQRCLAQKIFDKPDFNDDFSNMMVSWTQFNKEVLPGRQFTFWQWFEGAMDLTKKHLRSDWSNGLIYGFIEKQHLHLILKQKPNGTFLLRFSDSEIGGITIAYVTAADSGEHNQIIKNIQPLTKKHLDFQNLGDTIWHMNDLRFLYPHFPKQDVFAKSSSNKTTGGNDYLPIRLHPISAGEETNSNKADVANILHHTENHHNSAMYQGNVAPMESSDMAVGEFSPDPRAFSDMATGDMDLDLNNFLNFS